jgi:hypothetical protein
LPHVQKALQHIQPKRNLVLCETYQHKWISKPWHFLNLYFNIAISFLYPLRNYRINFRVV